MSKNAFIKLTLLSIFASTLCDELFEEDSLDLDNLKITDVLKKLTLPSAEEIRHILTSEDNSTKLPDSPKLKFILHAVEYWRNTLQDSVENETVANTDNITQVRFHLRDDFLDNDNTAYSHLSKKIHGNNRKVNRNVASVRDSLPVEKNTRRDSGRSLPLPYIYVKNFYMTDNLYADVSRSDLRKKN